MLQAAEIIAQKENAKYLITGENLAQVSSQTLQNLTTITKNIKLEILRPLLTYDKQEIIKKAKEIKTYETSKGPEICDLLGPRSPATKSKPEIIAKALAEANLQPLLEQSLNNAEIIEKK